MAHIIQGSKNQKTIHALVGRYPLVAFTILAYVISWIAWLLSERIDLGVVNGFGIIGSAGPALAGMIISALQKPEPSGASATKRWRLFWITGILVLTVMAARRLWITPEWLKIAGEVTTSVPFPSLLAFLVDVLAAGVVAFIVAGVLSSRQGVRALLHTLNPRSHAVRWSWWAAAVGLYPAIILLGNALSAQLGLGEPAENSSALWYWLVLDAFLTYLLFLFYGGGLEEPGWRGFALPLLQKRFRPLGSSLILGAIWAIWHWPLLKGGVLEMAFYMLLVVIPLAILFTAVFNRTGGSLLIVILLHVSINITPIFLPESSLATYLWLFLMLGLAIWMWRAPQAFSPRQVGYH